MKRFLHWSVVPACIALALGGFLRADDNSISGAFAKIAASMQKEIRVSIYAGPSLLENVDLSAHEGGNWGGSEGGGPDGRQVDENYKVSKDSTGHFLVSLHRSVVLNGTKSASDFTLPVWDKEPPAEKRIKLDDGTTAVAYFSKDSNQP